MRQYYVYLLECSDSTYYVGLTNDLDQRIMEHQQGFIQDCYTFGRRPVQLKYYINLDYINDAIKLEKRLKKWSRAKKLAYFEQDWDTLKSSSRCRNSSSHLNKK